VAGIGETLRAARRERGLTLQAVQQELRIREKYLQALEAENFSDIPGTVYARGFLRSYARFLDLDAEALVAQLPAQASAPAATAAPAASKLPPAAKPMRPVGPEHRSGSQWPWVVIPLVFLVALLYVVGTRGLLFGGSPSPQAHHQTTAQQKPKTHKRNSGGRENNAGTAKSQGKHKAAQEPKLESAPQTSGPYGGPQYNYTVKQGPITATLTLTGPCYIDALQDGTTVMSSVQTSGTLQFKAQQSLVIKFGNPPAAALKVDGRKVQFQGPNAQSIGVQVQGG